MDPSADYKALWVWLRQQGKHLYDGKKIGFTRGRLTKWFELWKGARDARPTPPADVIHVANAGDVTKQLVVTGQAATSFMWANQMPELAEGTKDTLGVISYPGDPRASGPVRPCTSSATEHQAPRHRGGRHQLLRQRPRGRQDPGHRARPPANTDVRTAVTSGLTDAAHEGHRRLREPTWPASSARLRACRPRASGHGPAHPSR